MAPITSQRPDPRVGAGERIEQGILRAVAYADVFDFPLTAGEIHCYLVGQRAGGGAVRSALAGLVPDRLEERDGYFCLPGRGELVDCRRRRREAASRLWPEALLYGRRIAALPFVRMVAVTGSLARDNVDPGADVDYLIVAEPGRVWVCRALVGLLTRWAQGRGVTLCANYYLAEDQLALRERDLYAAHELLQMVPVVGREAYRRLRSQNPWVAEYFPNAVRQDWDAWGGEPVRAVLELNGGRARRVAESLLRTRPGGWLDRLERERKLRKSIRQGRDLTEARFEPGCFKGHFDGHAARVLAAYGERLAALEKGGA